MTLRSITRHTVGIVSFRSSSSRFERTAGTRAVVAILFVSSAIVCTSCVSTPPDEVSQNSESRFLQEQQLKGMPDAHPH
jgi:hypothetical protein